MKKTYLVVLLSLITSLGFSQMTFEGSLSHDKNPLKKDLSQYEKKPKHCFKSRRYLGWIL